MKEKQGNKPNSYGKLTKRMLISLGLAESSVALPEFL